MKISYIHGVCVKNDAISNSIRDEITWLMSEPSNEVRLFVYACDFEEMPFTIVKDVKDVAFDSFFQQSDLVVFHFGVFYPLFNLLLVAPKKAKQIVVFHNITPKEHLPISNHELIDCSFAQMANIIFSTHVICDSETNLRALQDAGINVPSSVHALAVSNELNAPDRKPSFEDQILRIAFVGRLVQSKGPVELLEAVVGALVLNPDLSLKLDMIGNLNFSDQAVVSSVLLHLEDIRKRFGSRVEANLHGNCAEKEKKHLLACADLFVLPTYHEGFCVPIIEALASGCRVVAYENSNVPSISGGLAELVPTGDVALLTETVVAVADQIKSAAWRLGGGYAKYLKNVERHIDQFSPAVVRQKFLNFVETLHPSSETYRITDYA